MTRSPRRSGALRRFRLGLAAVLVLAAVATGTALVPAGSAHAAAGEVEPPEECFTFPVDNPAYWQDGVPVNAYDSDAVAAEEKRLNGPAPCSKPADVYESLCDLPGAEHCFLITYKIAWFRYYAWSMWTALGPPVDPGPTPTPTPSPGPTPDPGPEPEPEPEREGFYVIGLDGEPAGSDPVEIARLKQVALAHASGLGLTPDYVYGAVFTGYAGFLTAAQVAQARADEAVLSVEKYVEQIVPEGWAGFTGEPRPAVQPQVVPAAVARVGGSATGSGAAVDADIAILDTGIDLDHPDLDVVGGVDCTRRDGDGYDDDQGHGTQVAGLAAARDNGGDIVGTAPGARLWSVKISYFTNNHTYASWLCGMDWVVEHAAVIDSANNSSAARGYDEDVENSGDCDVTDHTNINTLISCAVKAAGVPFVVGAGNSRLPLSRGAEVLPFGGFSQYLTVSGLADYDGAPGGRAEPTCPDGAGDADDSFDDHSNFGPEVDLVAPSVCVLTTQVGGGTTTTSGTSLAAPLVAGAVAVYRAQHPGASPDQVVAHLRGIGSSDWDAADDPDGVQEPLLVVPGPGAPAPTGPVGSVAPPVLSQRYADLVPTEPRGPVSVIG